MAIGTLTNATDFQQWLFEATAASESVQAGTGPGFTELDWLEAVDNDGTRSDTISRERSSCTVIAYVPFAKYKSAVRFILGASYVEGTSLRRETPAWHPQWPWLYARAILNTTFVRFDGKEEGEYEGSLAYAKYEYAKITVEFAEVRYPIYEDTDITYEYERYVERRSVPYTDLLQIDGGNLKAYSPSVTSLNDKPPVMAPYVLVPVQKSAFDLIWYEVPLSFIQNNSGLQPKLAAMQKKVNSASFLGHPAGTLLCEDVETVVDPAPILTDINSGLEFTAKVTMHMKYFNPDRGDTAVSKYGWNLLPAPFKTGGGGDLGYIWLYYTHDGTESGKPLYQSYDFASAFTHWSV